MIYENILNLKNKAWATFIFRKLVKFIRPHKFFDWILSLVY